MSNINGSLSLDDGINVVSVEIIGILYLQYSAQSNFFTAKKSTHHSKNISYFELHLSTGSHNMLNWKYFIEKILLVASENWVWSEFKWCQHSVLLNCF